MSKFDITFNNYHKLPYMLYYIQVQGKNDFTKIIPRICLLLPYWTKINRKLYASIVGRKSLLYIDDYEFFSVGTGGTGAKSVALDGILQ